MPTVDNFPPIWPYTLDHPFPGRCIVPVCPRKTYPGFWEIPLVQWDDGTKFRCSMTDVCRVPETAVDTYNLIRKNFDDHYKTDRAPFGIFTHATWFLRPGRLRGLQMFLDVVLQDKNVWVVTAAQALQVRFITRPRVCEILFDLICHPESRQTLICRFFSFRFFVVDSTSKEYFGNEKVSAVAVHPKASDVVPPSSSLWSSILEAMRTVRQRLVNLVYFSYQHRTRTRISNCSVTSKQYLSYQHF